MICNIMIPYFFFEALRFIPSQEIIRVKIIVYDSDFREWECVIKNIELKLVTSIFFDFGLCAFNIQKGILHEELCTSSYQNN